MKKRFLIVLLVLVLITIATVLYFAFKKSDAQKTVDLFFPRENEIKKIASVEELHKTSGGIDSYDIYYMKLSFENSEEYKKHITSIFDTYSLVQEKDLPNFKLYDINDNPFDIEDNRIYIIDLTQTSSFDSRFVPLIIANDTESSIIYAYYSDLGAAANSVLFMSNLEWRFDSVLSVHLSKVWNYSLSNGFEIKKLDSTSLSLYKDNNCIVGDYIVSFCFNDKYVFLKCKDEKYYGSMTPWIKKSENLSEPYYYIIDCTKEYYTENGIERFPVDGPYEKDIFDGMFSNYSNVTEWIDTDSPPEGALLPGQE